MPNGTAFNSTFPTWDPGDAQLSVALMSGASRRLKADGHALKNPKLRNKVWQVRYLAGDDPSLSENANFAMSYDLAGLHATNRQSQSGVQFSADRILTAELADAVFESAAILASDWTASNLFVTETTAYGRTATPFSKPRNPVPEGRPPLEGAYVRGYYWILLLTPDVISQLGTIESVEANAPVAQTRRVHYGDSKRDGLLCRVAQLPASITTEQWREWRDFLRPVLGGFRPNFGLTRANVDPCILEEDLVAVGV